MDFNYLKFGPVAKCLNAVINATATKAGATEGELHYTTDTKVTYIYSGDLNIPVGTILTHATKTGAYTVTLEDSTIWVDASGGVITITLPTAVGIGGKIINIVKVDSSSNALTIDADGTETINGELTAVTAIQYTSLTLQSNNANWIII